MKILLVEDDPPKRDDISNFLNAEFSDIVYDVAISVNSASRKIEDNDYNLIILDMSLPNFDFDKDPTGGRPINYGGEDVLDYIDSLSRTTKVVIITQYPKFKDESGEKGLSEIGKMLQENYPTYFYGIIYYNAAIDIWKKELRQAIMEILRETN